MNIEFKDLIAEYPNRVRLTPVDGQADVFDTSPEYGEITQQGTPLRALELNQIASEINRVNTAEDIGDRALWEITIPGVYSQDDPTKATAANDYPLMARCILIVRNSNTGDIYQEITTTGSYSNKDKRFIRSGYYQTDPGGSSGLPIWSDSWTELTPITKQHTVTIPITGGSSGIDLVKSGKIVTASSYSWFSLITLSDSVFTTIPAEFRPIEIMRAFVGAEDKTQFLFHPNGNVEYIRDSGSGSGWFKSISWVTS